MTFEYRPAVRDRVSLLIGIAGPSGSGKTYSALRLAIGLAGPTGRVALIDTEAGRALHYAGMFKFDHGDLRPPFRPETYAEAIAAADKAGYDVIVVDSMSHEWMSEGGVLDWQEDELQRMAGDDWKKREACKMAAWIKPKMSHKKMISRLLQCRAHLVFCLRAEEKIEMKRVQDEHGRNKTVIEPKGWQPICEKNFMYEMTTSFLVLPDRPGVPIPIKLQEQHRFAFPDGQPITQQAGAALGEWAHGGAAPKTPAENRTSSQGPTQSAVPSADPFDEAAAAARQGKDAFMAWWNGPGKPKRAALRPRLPELQRIAADADGADKEDPFAADTGTDTGTDTNMEKDTVSEASERTSERTSAPALSAKGVYQFVDWDGEVEELPGGYFCDRVEAAIASAKSASLLEAMWENNSTCIDMLAADSDQSLDWYNGLMDAYRARRESMEIKTAATKVADPKVADPKAADPKTEPASTAAPEGGVQLLDEHGTVMNVFKRATPWFDALKRNAGMAKNRQAIIEINRAGAERWVALKAVNAAAFWAEIQKMAEKEKVP